MAYLFLMLGVSLLLPLLRLAFRLRLGLPMLFALGMLTVCHGWYQAHTALADGIFLALVGLAALHGGHPGPVISPGPSVPG